MRFRPSVRANSKSSAEKKKSHHRRRRAFGLRPLTRDSQRAHVDPDLPEGGPPGQGHWLVQAVAAVVPPAAVGALARVLEPAGRKKKAGQLSVTRTRSLPPGHDRLLGDRRSAGTQTACRRPRRSSRARRRAASGTPGAAAPGPSCRGSRSTRSGPRRRGRTRRRRRSPGAPWPPGRSSARCRAAGCTGASAGAAGPAGSSAGGPCGAARPGRRAASPACPGARTAASTARHKGRVVRLVANTLLQRTYT